MPENTYWGSCKAAGTNIIDKLKDLIHEGNVRRVVIQHQGRRVAEFPLSAGVVGALLAPMVAAAGAVVALLKDCSIRVERGDGEPAERTSTGTDRP